MARKYGLASAAAALCVLIAATDLPSFAADAGVKQHAVSLVGTPHYGPDFTHFDWVNPNAPKGGRVRQWALGSFDSLNPFPVKGSVAAGVSLAAYRDGLARGRQRYRDVGSRAAIEVHVRLGGEEIGVHFAAIGQRCEDGPRRCLGARGCWEREQRRHGDTKACSQSSHMHPSTAHGLVATRSLLTVTMQVARPVVNGQNVPHPTGK